MDWTEAPGTSTWMSLYRRQQMTARPIETRTGLLWSLPSRSRVPIRFHRCLCLCLCVGERHSWCMRIFNSLKGGQPVGGTFRAKVVCACVCLCVRLLCKRTFEFVGKMRNDDDVPSLGNRCRSKANESKREVDNTITGVHGCAWLFASVYVHISPRIRLIPLVWTHSTGYCCFRFCFCFCWCLSW